MSIEFGVSDIIPAGPEEIYSAWVDSEAHSAMTGGRAEVSNVVGESFTAWNGYITGKNLLLEPGKRIRQTWRTSEFAASDPDSIIEVRFEPVEGGTLVTIYHTNLPDHGNQYKQGWRDAYFEPMKSYFQPD